MKKSKFLVGILCGGPSLERGISLNSARSLMDHLESESVEVRAFYFDSKKNAYALSVSQLYSNTPADFDFKLSNTAFPLSDELLEKELKTLDIVFPAMHGVFGEDGSIQKWLSDRDIPFVGADADACKKAFDKFKANEFIKSKGFYTLPSCVLKIYKDDENRETLKKFFKDNNIERAVVKPATGGSSIGVFSVETIDQAMEKVELIFSKRMDTRVVVEPFAIGKEFTVIILQSKYGLPVAILPTEIEADYTEHQIFDYRKKYLPTRQVTYHCPPRFEDSVIERIQIQAEQLFVTLGMKDFARFDGWVLEDGNIWFSDFNPISGMEQNSFLFQQSSRVGLSHRGVLNYILKNSSARQGIKINKLVSRSDSTEQNKTEMPIIMGGESSERQVSLMSGTNVWLKLRKSDKIKPIPFIMENENTFWRVPYQLLLNHTVEEILENTKAADLDNQRISKLVNRVREKLGFNPSLYSPEFIQPHRLTLKELMSSYDDVFIALHGGFGEDGSLQSILEKNGINFNGPNSVAARLAMNKQQTSEKIQEMKIPGVKSIKGCSYPLDYLNKHISSNPEKLFKEISTLIGSRNLIAKPFADGCSSGVVHISNASDLKLYVKLLFQNADAIDPNTFKGQSDRIELPSTPPEKIRFEKFVDTDSIKIKSSKLKHTHKSGLVEITIGVVKLEDKLHAFNPSITVSDGEVLSVEEKFQGGTGINLTPPPTELISKRVCTLIKKRVEKLATEIGIDGYCRIDAFVECKSGDLQIIEINSLPALTPSTVLFQQALAEDKPIYPMELLEIVATNKR